MPTRTKQNRVPQNGAAIREIRVREGLTPAVLARHMRVSEPHLRNIENEHRPATTLHLAMIADKLGCSIASLRRGYEDGDA